MKNYNSSRFERGSGILLHITSLPGKFGIGNLGKSAFEFIDYLEAGGQKYWQILPVGPVSSGYSRSPYSSYSSFAGNPLLIDPVTLQGEPWMKSDILSKLKEQKNNQFVDFEKVETEIFDILKIGYKNFIQNSSGSVLEEYNDFCEKNEYWLNDYSLFVSLADRFNTFNWRSWDNGIKNNDSETIINTKKLLNEQIGYHKFIQYIFEKQWKNLKLYSKKKNISLIGDIPIYAGMDSADVWANTGIFQFSQDLFPTGVSGVPPDYFSENGQKWGTPIYRWFKHGTRHLDTYNWWYKRMKRYLELVDIVRIDHFRAFSSFWSIDPGSSDGKNGHWEVGPGKEFFDFLREKLGSLPVIAEDLGIINEDVEKLRSESGFPGMKILQFAFDGQPDNPYIPENLSDPNCVIYTGTHDNNTSKGWFFEEISDESTKQYIKNYLGIDDNKDFIQKFIELALSSIADISIIPLQDILELPGSFRFNTPGTTNNRNWCWKTVSTSLETERMKKLRSLCELYKR